MTHEVRRNLSAAALAEIAIDFTRPIYLVQMNFANGSSYLSTGMQVTFGGNVYSEGQVSVGSFVWNSDGAQQGEIILSNENNAAAALILGNNVNDVEIIIYQTYVKADGSVLTPQLYVRGSMDGSDIGISESVISVLSSDSQTGFVPRRYYTVAEGFNWLPIDGDVISWGGEVFQLRAED